MDVVCHAKGCQLVLSFCFVGSVFLLLRRLACREGFAWKGFSVCRFHCVIVTFFGYHERETNMLMGKMYKYFRLLLTYFYRYIYMYLVNGMVYFSLGGACLFGVFFRVVTVQKLGRAAGNYPFVQRSFLENKWNPWLS